MAKRVFTKFTIAAANVDKHWINSFSLG